MSDSERPWWAVGCSPDLTRRDITNLRRVNLALAGLMASFLLARYLISRDLVALPLTGLVPLLPALAAIPFYRAMASFLRQADELTRRMHVQAMAAGFGAAVVLVLVNRVAMQAAEAVGEGTWVGLFAKIVDPMAWMFVAYAVALARQQWRYGR